MEDKTPVYILAIVGIVAVVAVIFMLTGSTQTNTIADLNNDNGGAITGNAITEDIQPIIGINIIGKILLVSLLGGAVLHMYHKW
jgi:multisubunit Na+/H+ antiporter MnhB subunit